MGWFSKKSRCKKDSKKGSTRIKFKVAVPDFVAPGEEFKFYAGNRIVRIFHYSRGYFQRCPSKERSEG